MPSTQSPLKKAARNAAWPLRRFFGPQFQWVREEVKDSDQRVRARMDRLEAAVNENAIAASEALAQAGQELRATGDWLATLRDTVQELRRQMDDLRVTGDWLASLQQEVGALRVTQDELASLREELRSDPFERFVDADVEEIDLRLARLLDYAESHLGFRAQRGLWLNPPVQVSYRPGIVEAVGVNERIVEVPYVFRALQGLPAGARVLDLGSSESTAALSLASLGLRVTALDLRDYPFEHPLLESVGTALEGWEGPEEPFDAIVCLSSIEHFGVGAYGERGGGEAADRVAMQRLAGMTRPGGRLVLTTPFGRAALTETERVYDRAALERLLEGWEIDDLSVARQAEPTVWVPDELPGDDDQLDDQRRVALVSAHLPEAAGE